MLYQDSLNHVFSRLLEGVLGVKRCFIETVAKTGLFGATELVLYRIPDNTDNRDPVYGRVGNTFLGVTAVTVLGTCGRGKDF